MKKIILAIYSLAIVSALLVPVFVSAQTSSIRTEAFSQLNSAAGSGGAGFGNYKDPRETASRVIRVVLGLIGTIFIVLAVYSGFLWMTAGGEEENITKAKGILRAAIIGLAIILSAYSVTIFVSDKLLKATSGNGDGQNLNLPDFCVENPADPNCAL